MKKLKLNIDKLAGPAPTDPTPNPTPITPNPKQVLKAIIKALLFIIYVYGLVKISPFLFDEIFSIDLFTWLRPVAGSILALVAYSPLINELIRIMEIFDNDDDNDDTSETGLRTCEHKEDK